MSGGGALKGGEMRSDRLGSGRDRRTLGIFGVNVGKISQIRRFPANLGAEDFDRERASG